MRDLIENHLKGPGGIREMLAIAFPMVISSSCETVMTFTDRLFMARIGPEQMSAAMGGALTSFMMMTFFWGLVSFSTALVAQYLGSGRKHLCAEVITQGLILSVIAYPIILAARPLAIYLFEYLHIPPEQLQPQILYFNILIYGTILRLLSNCLSCFFSGIGRTRIVMVSAIVSMVANVILNYILIFGHLGFPAMGIRGAAYGTIIGTFCGLVILTAAYFSKDMRSAYSIMRSFRFDWDVMKRLLRYGYPAGIELFLNLLAFDLLVLIFHGTGLVTAAAITIVFNWDMVSFLPMLGVNIGVTSLVGRYMGAGSPETAHRATLSGLKLTLAYSFGILVTFVIFAEFLVGLFRPRGSDELFSQVFPLAVTMVRLTALYVMADAVLIVFSGALRGAGDTFWAMKTSVLLHWLMVGILVLLLNVLKLSPTAAWAAMCCVFMLFSGVFYVRYRGGKWRSLRIVEPAEQTVVPGIDSLHEQD
ncbi:MAG: MATE family efflux transporter [Planctomycetaceae bacterium]|nr:MATE family efflux transporter [Planctomycetaceae bacterium]